MSMTSYPMFGSDYGAGLSASAYSKHSKMSGFSRSRSISPANLNQNRTARHYGTFHG